MIKVTRLQGDPIVINAEHILLVESTPDTTVTLTNGHRVILKDDVDDLIRNVVQYKQWIMQSVHRTISEKTEEAQDVNSQQE